MNTWPLGRYSASRSRRRTQDVETGYPQNPGIARRITREREHAGRAGSLVPKKPGIALAVGPDDFR